MSLDSGSNLGPYEIIEPIGKGGMGEVYRARDPRMGREVAIKVSAERFSDRFSREVHAVAALSHANVCTLHDVGPDYLVMELVEGRTLAERIAEGPIPVEEALEIARQIAFALEAAHEKGIVHRDLKPANIKLKPDGTVKVLDFGLAMVNTPTSTPSAESPTFATSGGSATQLTKVNTEAKETGHGYPQFLPDGNRFLFFIASTDPNVQGMYASSLNDPENRELVMRTGTKALYTPSRDPFPGYLLWIQEGTLLAQRFDAASLKREGDPVSIASDVGVNPSLTVRASFWVSDSGLLTYFARPERQARAIVWFDRNGTMTQAAPPEIVQDIALSPDGKRLAIAREEVSSGPANRDIWIRELATGVVTRLTFHQGLDAMPIWSPDGKWIAYSSEAQDGSRQIYRKDASGGGQEEVLTSGANVKIPLDWSRDGKYILYREQNPGTGRDLMAVPLDGERKPIPVVQTPFAQNSGEISPDGRWVAYLSNDSGRSEIFVQAFPGAKDTPVGRWQISNGGAQEVRWRNDGKEIYYESDGKVMAVALQAAPQGVRAETPRALFPADFRAGSTHEFDTTADGQRFLMIVDPETETITNRLTVISNWQATVGKRGLR